MEWNGMEWNRIEWNRIEWNGMEWNGMQPAVPPVAPMLSLAINSGQVLEKRLAETLIFTKPDQVN